jgi:hypothetical protein
VTGEAAFDGAFATWHSFVIVPLRLGTRPLLAQLAAPDRLAMLSKEIGESGVMGATPVS